MKRLAVLFLSLVLMIGLCSESIAEDDFAIRNDIHFGDSKATVLSKENGTPKWTESDHITYLGIVATIDHSYCSFYFSDDDKLSEVVYKFNTYAGDDRGDSNFYNAGTVSADYDTIYSGLVEKYGDPTTDGSGKTIFKNSKIYQEDISWMLDLFSFKIDKDIIWIVKSNGYYVGISLAQGHYASYDGSTSYYMALDYKYLTEEEVNSLGNAKNDL